MYISEYITTWPRIHEGGLKCLYDNVVSDGFFTNEIQGLQHRWKNGIDCKGSMLKNKQNFGNIQ